MTAHFTFTRPLSGSPIGLEPRPSPRHRGLADSRASIQACKFQLVFQMNGHVCAGSPATSRPSGVSRLLPHSLSLPLSLVTVGRNVSSAHTNNNLLSADTREKNWKGGTIKLHNCQSALVVKCIGVNSFICTGQ